jgi:endogenous inhibitor of DNA gyrase (YacG/DUF329 family)
MQWRCPICRKPTDSAISPNFPFCSERCRLYDLGNWAAERYVISEQVLDESGEERTGPQDRAPDGENEGNNRNN